MTWVDVVGFLAFLTNVAGNLLLASKTIWGWYVRIVSILLWLAYAYDTASMPLIANALTFFGINCYGLWKWKREARSKVEREVTSSL